LRIDVVDTGPGIAAEDLDTIFEEFHQLGNPQRSRQDGHGLGLAIVRRTARSLDHPLEVRSVVGKGSRFSVEIPLVGRPVAEIPPPEPAEPPAIETCDVLVVEDDPLVNEAMQWVLRDLGCTVLAVTSGDEVEAALEDMTPDLVIADFRLPGDRNGVDVITAVRRRLGRPVPACIITGDVSDAVRTLTEAAGVEWLSKPIRPEDLSRQVEQACCSKVICSEQT
jgi:CheY-like chemotaxis protein